MKELNPAEKLTLQIIRNIDQSIQYIESIIDKDRDYWYYNSSDFLINVSNLYFERKKTQTRPAILDGITEDMRAILYSGEAEDMWLKHSLLCLFKALRDCVLTYDMLDSIESMVDFIHILDNQAKFILIDGIDAHEWHNIYPDLKNTSFIEYFNFYFRSYNEKW